MIHIPLLMIGTTELLVIGGAVLLLFGGKKIPELMRSLGSGVKEFKQGMNEVTNPDTDKQQEETNEDDSSEEKQKPQQETATDDGKEG